MAINWPRDVNFNPARPYTRNIKLPIMEEDNDLGLPTRVRIGSKPIITHNFVFVFSKEEFVKLEKWVADKLYCGLLSFYFSDPLTKELKTGRFKLNDSSWYSSIEISQTHITLDVSIEETNEPIIED